MASASFERSSVPARDATAEVVVVGVRAGQEPTHAAAELDHALDGAITAHLKATGFKGNTGDAELIPTGGRLPASLQLVGPHGSEEHLLALGAVVERAVS